MSDQVCRVQYFPGSIKNCYDNNGDYIGKDDHIAQECVQKPIPNPNPSPSPKPNSSPSLWKTALAYLGYSKKNVIINSQGTSRCGGISEACQDKSPKYSLIEPPTDKYDYSNPKTVIYKIHGIANCDWTLNDIEVNAYFDPNTNIPTRATLQKGATYEGHETLTAVLQHKFNAQIQGKISVFIKGANGKTTELPLYPPLPTDTGTTTKTQCEYANNRPSISPISINPKSSNGLYPIGSEVTIEASAADCDGLSNGANLSAQVWPYANAYLEMTDKGNMGPYKVFSRTFTIEKQTKSFCVTVADKDRSTSAEKCMDVTVIPASSSSSSSCSTPYPFSTTVNGPTPLSNYDVTSNTAVTWIIHAKNCDGTTNGLSASCDFGSLGTVTANGDSNGVITISKALTKPATGKFSCDITGSNGKTSTNEATLWPPFYKDLSPNTSIQAPSSAPVNTSVSFSVPTPTSGATYSWDFKDGNSSTGTSVYNTYTQTGKYEVELTAVYSGFTSTNKVNITIY